MWGARARTGLMRWYQRKVVRVVTSSLAIRMSPGHQRESWDGEAIIISGLVSLSSLCGITITRVTGQGHCSAADRLQMTSQTSHNEDLCSALSRVTWRIIGPLSSQDPGHYGDITMPWHSYSGHPGTFYLNHLQLCNMCSSISSAHISPLRCRGRPEFLSRWIGVSRSGPVLDWQRENDARSGSGSGRRKNFPGKVSHPQSQLAVSRPGLGKPRSHNTNMLCDESHGACMLRHWPVCVVSRIPLLTPKTNIWREAEDIYLKSDIKPFKTVLFHFI